MKKIIAILLALITVFSMVSIGASAYTMENDGVWMGVDGDVVYADPGKTANLPISVAAKLDDEKLAEDKVDTASAILYIPFSLETDANSPIQKIEISDAAKAAGATFEQGKTDDKGVIYGTILLPLSALKGNESIVVLNVEVKMDENWKVEDYKAVNPVTVKVAEKYLSDGVRIYDKDSSADNAKSFAKLIPATFTIKATPYKANIFEKAFEWIKAKIRGFYVLFQTLNNYLLSDPLEAPDWVKQEENRAKRDAEAAKAAEELEVA